MKEDKRKEAIRLRTETGASFTEILRVTRVAKSTLSLWLKPFPAPAKNPLKTRDSRGPERAVFGPNRPHLSKADIGEAARQMIIARLLLAEIAVFKPVTEDTPVDLLVLTPSGRALKCQCKCLYVKKNGSHAFALVSIRKWGPGKKAVAHKYTAEEVDFFLGYSIQTDDIFVLPFSECRGRSALTLWLCNTPKSKNSHKHFDHTPWKNAFHLLRL